MTISDSSQDQILAQSIVEDLPDMIFVKDAKHLRFVRVNKAAENILGLTREEMYGKSDHDFFAPEEADFFITKDREVLRNGKVLDIPEEPIHTANGLRWLHTRKVPIFDKNGEPIFLLGISTDITERKRVEKALEDARQEIKHLEDQALQDQLHEAKRMESLGVLAGGIAHDFNNLLVSMLGNSNLVLKTLSKDSPVRPNIVNIEMAAERAAELTRQMLAYSGRGQIQLELLDIPAVVEDTVALLRHGGLLEPIINIESLDISSVYADSSQIRQLCMNVILNAIDAVTNKADAAVQVRFCSLSREEAMTLDGLLELEPTNLNYVQLIVSDNGIGMDEETRQRMFDPFFTTKSKGHGLGLAAALGIVRGHEGNLIVESKLGEGTSISVLLPARSQVQRNSPQAKIRRTAEGKHRHVLVVDDEPFVRRFVMDALPAKDYTVYSAKDGPGAIELFTLHQDAIDIVLLDLSIPQMSGEVVFAHLKEIRPTVPIVLSSGYAEADIEERLGSYQASAYLHKPYRSEDLIDMIQRVLSPPMD
jgi:two-component system, cell cycle sensor histidine kinase and response regulator CckA